MKKRKFAPVVVYTAITIGGFLGIATEAAAEQPQQERVQSTSSEDTGDEPDDIANKIMLGTLGVVWSTYAVSFLRERSRRKRQGAVAVSFQTHLDQLGAQRSDLRIVDKPSQTTEAIVDNGASEPEAHDVQVLPENVIPLRRRTQS